MPVAAAVAAIAAAVIGAGVSVGTHVAKKRETERAKNEARGLGQQERADILKEGGLARRERKEQLQFQKKEAALSRKERQSDRFRGSLMSRANQFASQLNTDEQLKGRLLQQSFVRRR